MMPFINISVQSSNTPARNTDHMGIIYLNSVVLYTVKSISANGTEEMKGS